ncbi:MAG: carboxypeptidase regulatory-like domain-containing protein, partial [Acidobacteriota bacterium]
TGAFRIEDLAPGPYDVHVFGPEFADTIKHDIKIEPGKTTDLGTITVVRGRRLAGRVVDASGTPVAGARVKLGEMLFSAAGSDDDQAESWEDMAGIRSTVTDQDGAFSLPGVPPKATTVMADHPDRGRSLPQPVPGGTEDPPPMTLALRGFGSIIGKVVQKGVPQPNVTVSESTKGGALQAAFAQTASDGTFTMPKVAEGTHVLNALQQQLMAMKATSVTVEVTAGKQTQVTIDIPVGTIALTVEVHAMANNKVDAAQVFLIAGTASIANAKQLADGLFQGGMQGMKFWFGEGKPEPEFDELVAGNYSVCSVPITGDLSDPQFQQRVQDNMQTLKVYCKPVKVNASPNAQTVVQELPAMTPLPSPKT